VPEKTGQQLHRRGNTLHAHRQPMRARRETAAAAPPAAMNSRHRPLTLTISAVHPATPMETIMLLRLPVLCLLILTTGLMAEEHWYKIEIEHAKHKTYSYFGSSEHDLETLLQRVEDETFIVLSNLSYRSDGTFYRWSNWMPLYQETIAIRCAAILIIAPLSGDPLEEQPTVGTEDAEIMLP
jgi:hypothetical protein